MTTKINDRTRNLRRMTLRAAIGVALLSGTVGHAADPIKTIGKDVTQVNFEDTMIEGKMKAPSSFMLQGRQNQASQLVKLRANFREELRDSQPGARSTIK